MANHVKTRKMKTAVAVSFIYLCYVVIELLNNVETVNNTSPSLPEKPLESEHLFRNCDCDTYFTSFLKS